MGPEFGPESKMAAVDNIEHMHGSPIAHARAKITNINKSKFMHAGNISNFTPTACA